MLPFIREHNFFNLLMKGSTINEGVALFFLSLGFKEILFKKGKTISKGSSVSGDAIEEIRWFTRFH